MVPEGWKLTSLKEVCNNQLQTGPFGNQLHSHEYVDEGIPVLMPKDLIDFKVNTKTAAKITKERSNSLQKHWLHYGDIIFSRRGDVARFALIDEKVGLTICGTGCLRVRPTENFLPKYVSYFLQLHQVKKWLEQNAVGQTMPNMNTEILGELPLKLSTNIDEQTKIAEILSTWDKTIATTEQLLANSQQQKKALMQQLLTGKKRLLDENGVRFSGEWKGIRLKSVLCEVKARNKENSIDRVLSVTNHSGFVLPEEQFSKRVASESVSNYKVIKKGQYGYNPSRLNVGSFARLDSYEEGLLSPMYVVFSVREKVLNSDYFMNWMSSSEAKQRISGSTQGSVRDSVGFDSLCGFPFKLPPMVEQQKIAAVLSVSDQEIERLQKKVEFLKQEKKSLIQQLLTGKLRVKI